MKKSIPILAYHSLDPGRFPNKLAVSPELFKKQMLSLRRKRFQVVSLEAGAKSGWSEGFFERQVAITFGRSFL